MSSSVIHLTVIAGCRGGFSADAVPCASKPLALGADSAGPGSIPWRADVTSRLLGLMYQLWLAGHLHIVADVLHRSPGVLMQSLRMCRSNFDLRPDEGMDELSKEVTSFCGCSTKVRVHFLEQRIGVDGGDVQHMEENDHWPALGDAVTVIHAAHLVNGVNAGLG